MKYLSILLVSILFVGTVFAGVSFLNYQSGSSLNPGFFYSDARGNAGSINFGGTSMINGVQIAGDIWIQAIGTGTFQANIIPPAGNPTIMCWNVNGKIVTQNAGDINLSQVQYNPISKKLEGYGYNPGLGNVWLGDGTYCSGGANTEIALTGAAFIGKVKVLGRVSSNSVYNFSSDYSIGETFDVKLMNRYINNVRKNVAYMTRNTPSNSIGEEHPIPILNFYYFRNDTLSLKQMHYNNLLNNVIDGVVVVGADIYIDTDIWNSSWKKPKGIIVLKNDEGIGGNIYIASGVTNIQSSIFTEGSIYSGDFQNNLYNDTALKLSDLPENQLYILGSVFSRNTIGGSSKNPAVCPYSGNCSNDIATQYDFNTFRNFDNLAGKRGYGDNSLDAYSVIIQYDPRIVTLAPPGF